MVNFVKTTLTKRERHHYSSHWRNCWCKVVHYLSYCNQILCTWSKCCLYKAFTVVIWFSSWIVVCKNTPFNWFYFIISGCFSTFSAWVSSVYLYASPVSQAFSAHSTYHSLSSFEMQNFCNTFTLHRKCWDNSWSNFRNWGFHSKILKARLLAILSLYTVVVDYNTVFFHSTVVQAQGFRTLIKI